MNQYRRPSKHRWPSKFAVFAFVLLTVAFVCLFYQIHKIRFKIETQPPELQPPIATPARDPCLELRQVDDLNKKAIIDLRQRQSALLSELALEVELSIQAGGGKVASNRIVELIRKYDNTETRIYSKLYPLAKTEKKR